MMATTNSILVEIGAALSCLREDRLTRGPALNALEAVEHLNNAQQLLRTTNAHCAWCGEVFSKDVDYIEAFKIHVNTCEKHPAHKLLKACKESLLAIDEAYTSTGHLKVARTSKQRQDIEDAIRYMEGREQQTITKEDVGTIDPKQLGLE